jgi:ribonuclease HI
MEYTIATDGSCLKNPGPGGYGIVYLFMNDDVKVKTTFYGCKTNTTNNVMELEAVIQALHHIPVGNILKILTDSAYVVGGVGQVRYTKTLKNESFELTGWLRAWIKNGWKTADGKPVKNRKSWEKIWNLLEMHAKGGSIITFQHIKAHNGHPLNEEADKLAKKGANEALLSASESLFS